MPFHKKDAQALSSELVTLAEGSFMMITVLPVHPFSSVATTV